MKKGFRLPSVWPEPADPQAATRLIERFSELGRREARLAQSRRGGAMLRCLGGGSSYLADLVLREPAALRLLAAKGPGAVVDRAMADLVALSPTTPRAPLAASLRGAKRVVALATAIADIGGLWRLERVTETLSHLAETALQAATAHLLRAAHDAGELILPNPDAPVLGSGFAILGMGKLGARELNYSSDIDLILLHDPDSGVCDPDLATALFTRVARGLVTLIEARDHNGYVFRMDLRLRPDPAATPPSIALPAAIAYYESMGENWERAAMLKARPVAGDLALGAAFLDAIRPFVWRRHLDFAAVADLHAMKRRIDEHKGTALAAGQDDVARIAGHDVKLGQGGIREIEFLAQTLQLVWGGRDPGLRAPRTLDALRLLARSGRLPVRAAAELATAYRYLRRVEHRLQMVADRQTHALPETRPLLERFAVFLGYADAAGFASVLLRHMTRVLARYAEVFVLVPDPSCTDIAASLDFSGPDDAPPRTVAALQELGYTNPVAIIAAVRGWRAGRVRALRSLRARELMAQMLPRLLQALARQGLPDSAFARFDAFLGQLPAGVQLLSLFQRNPTLMDRVAIILGAAPSLADHLTRTPSALEGLLAPIETTDTPRLLRTRLADARTLEEAIAIIRRTVREEDFAIAAATLEGRLDADAAGLARADLADAALAALLPRVLDDFAARHGQVPSGALAVVLLGKAGGREMMAGSDLDMMLVYDHPEDVTESTGARRLPASQWFIRAVHAYVAALMAPDAEGPMFAVDMRLRPSGNKGPVAVSLRAFQHYHAADAWTWERMALTRARVVAGPEALRSAIKAAIAVALTSGGSPDRIRADAASMRARLLRDLPATGPWDVKLRPGGQIEVEFITQTLLLIHAGDPAVPHTTTLRIALAGLRDAGFLPADDAALVIRADRVWRSIQGLLRIIYGRAPPAKLSDASAAALLRAANEANADSGDAPAVDLDQLRATMDRLAQAVRAAFVRHVGEIRL